MASKQLTAESIWSALEQVMDPEIPVVSVVELGIIREVTVNADRVTVQMTPTFSGCPALHVMKADVEECLLGLGASEVVIETILSPPWTSDWITEDARDKLKRFGLSPPPIHGGRIEVTFYDLAPCPYCDSTNTTVKNTFGPTLCRAIYYCESCQQPFEQFKPL